MQKASPAIKAHMAEVTSLPLAQQTSVRTEFGCHRDFSSASEWQVKFFFAERIYS